MIESVILLIFHESTSDDGRIHIKALTFLSSTFCVTPFLSDHQSQTIDEFLSNVQHLDAMLPVMHVYKVELLTMHLPHEKR